VYKNEQLMGCEAQLLGTQTGRWKRLGPTNCLGECPGEKCLHVAVRVSATLVNG